MHLLLKLWTEFILNCQITITSLYVDQNNRSLWSTPIYLLAVIHDIDSLILVLATEHCQLWKNSFVEVIDTERTNSYLFHKGVLYSSYQLEPLISYRNSTTGEWQFFNLSGNVLMLENGPDPTRFLQIKVTVCYFSNFIEAIVILQGGHTSNQLINLLHILIIFWCIRCTLWAFTKRDH